MRRIISLSALVLACLWPAVAGAKEASPVPPAVSSPVMSVAPVPSGERPVIDVIKVDGIIDKPMQDYILEELGQAEMAGHVVALQLDSPGTLGVPCEPLVERIAEAKIPILTWVGPPGARAKGCAAVLAYASSLLSISPGSGVGPGAPVDLADKASGLPASVGDLATRAPRNAATTVLAAQQAIDAGVAMPLPSGVKVSASNVVDFLSQADGQTVDTSSGPVVLDTKVVHTPSEGTGVVVSFTSLGPLRRVLHSVASPTAVYVLLLLGIAGIAFEVTQPGFGFAGIAGVIAVGLAVYGMFAVPPFWGGLLVLLAGNALLVLDVRMHRLGVASVVGLIGFVVGSYLLYPQASASIAISPWLIWPATVAAALYYGFGLTVAMQARERITTAQMGLVGLVGEVRSDLNPVGGVVVKGTVWRAKSVGEHIPAGARVRVRGIDGAELRVEAEPEFDDDEIPSPPPV